MWPLLRSAMTIQAVSSFSYEKPIVRCRLTEVLRLLGEGLSLRDRLDLSAGELHIEVADVALAADEWYEWSLDSAGEQRSPIRLLKPRVLLDFLWAVEA